MIGIWGVWENEVYLVPNTNIYIYIYIYIVVFIVRN